VAASTAARFASNLAAPRAMTTSAPRFSAAALTGFAHALLVQAGMRDDIATDVAEILVEADLLGHTTHGLALLAPYLTEIEQGKMAKSGSPEVVNERAAAQTWDGRRLPGPWLTLRALDAAAEMADAHGTGTVVIRRSHHIACLAAYLIRATERGLIALVQSSDPLLAAVVPHGGVTPIITPNPIAAGLPTSGDPVLVDVSTSITSMGFAHQERAAGRRLPGPWLLDCDGNATDDPTVLASDPKGALLPLGGLDAGYKGFGLALVVEALTAGLAGFGRADPTEGWGGTVFVQVLDPEAFGGLEAFRRQMDHLVRAAHESKPRAGVDRVRLPGEGGLRRRREQLANGVALYPAIVPALGPWAAKLGVAIPTALA
jgi:LDH2 family malate/lactate/ureidoglycolate dehydrogenase